VPRQFGGSGSPGEGDEVGKALLQLIHRPRVGEDVARLVDGLVPLLRRRVDVLVFDHVRPRELHVEGELVAVGAVRLVGWADELPNDRIVPDVEAGLG
jgi:hypothetical protein